MKITWKGSISFGLVNIPIKLYSAIQPHAIGFTLLHEKCHTPLEYRRWCPHCDKEVVWSDTVKGLKTSKGYIVLTQDMLKKMKPETTQTLSIIEFIDASQLNPLYINNHYYIVPDKVGVPAFELFSKALENLNKIAIGRFIMHEKEHTCALYAYNNQLLLTTLHYSYEIKELPKEAISIRQKINAQELKLAESLINKLTAKKFDMTQFKDTFAQKIKTLLTKKPKRKAKTKKVAKKIVTRKKPTLIETLRTSLKEMPATRRAR